MGYIPPTTRPVSSRVVIISQELCGTIPYNQIKTALDATTKRDRKAGHKRAFQTLKALDLIPVNWTAETTALGLVLSGRYEASIIAALDDGSTTTEARSA